MPQKISQKFSEILKYPIPSIALGGRKPFRACFVNVRNFNIHWFPFSALTAELRHTTLLEELVFWTVKYEFPERLVCLLLKLLPDTQYKEALTRSFVRHYSRVSMMLMKSHNSDKLSNRIVHVSVQLFSNEELGTYIYSVLLQNDDMKLA